MDNADILLTTSRAVGYYPLGLDIETSTNSTESGGKILSIGCYDPLGERESEEDRYFYREIRYKKLVVMPESMQVNKLDIREFGDKEKMTAKMCDIELSNWLDKNKYIPVGFNVGSFDMRFVREQLTRSTNKLGYRALDIHTLCFEHALKRDIGWKAIKKRAKQYAGEKMRDMRVDTGDTPFTEHNALYDAIMAIFCLEYFVSEVK